MRRARACAAPVAGLPLADPVRLDAVRLEPGELMRTPARPRIRRQDVGQLDRPSRGIMMLRDYLGHGIHYSGERDSAREECAHAFLVGRVEYGRHGPAG